MGKLVLGLIICGAVFVLLSIFLNKYILPKENDDSSTKEKHITPP